MASRLETREVNTETDDNRFPYCEVHQKRKVAMYCVDCECSVCLACIAGDHVKHVFKEIPDMIQKKADELSRILGLLKVETLPVLTDKLIEVKKIHEFHRDRYSECVSEIRGRGTMLKTNVDKVIDEYIEEMNIQEKADIGHYTEIETRLTERIHDIGDIVTKGGELLKSLNAGLVSFVTEAKQQLRISKDTGPSDCRNIPEFNPSKIDQLIIQRLFGHKTLNLTDPETKFDREESNYNGVESTNFEAQSRHEMSNKSKAGFTDRDVKSKLDEGKKKSEQSKDTGRDSQFQIEEGDQSSLYHDLTSSLECGSDYVEQNQCIRQSQEPRDYSDGKVKTVTTFSHPKRVVNICALSGKRAWFSGDGYLDLLNCDGQTEKSILVNFPIYGMTLTKKGEILFGTEGKIKKMTIKGQFIDFAKTSPFDVYGIFTTGDQFLACMYDSIHVGKLEKLSQKGKVLQTIQFDRNKRALFGMPIYITQIDSGDIWVSDRNNNCVVVLTCEGELKFRYRGPNLKDLDKPFKPKYLSSDQVGHVLVNDIGSHNIHLVDLEGNFVQFLLINDHGFDGRWTLAQEKDNFIWMACAAHKTIIIFQKI